MPDWKALVRSKLATLALPAEREAEMVEELALLLEDYYQEARSRGASEEEAAGFAHSQVPSWETLAAGIRQADGPARRLGERWTGGGAAMGDSARAGLMGGIVNDLRFGLRVLAKQPGFTLLAALILALGIGLNTSVFSVVNAMLFAPLPVRAPEELVRVYSSTPNGFLDHEPMAYPDYRDIRDRTRSLDPLAAYSLSPLALESGEESEFVIGEIVSGNYFVTLGLRATLGRTLESEDDREGAPRSVAVLSHSTWKSRFGADPAILGEQLRLNGHLVTVVGVGPAGFHGLARGVSAELWIPMELTTSLGALSTVSADEPTANLPKLDDRGLRWLWVMGRRKPEVAFEQAAAELRLLGEQLKQEYPETNERRSIVTLAATDVRFLPGVDGALTASSAVLMGFVALVLLIACANIANMLLARAAARSQEIGVRLSLGASRGRLIRQLLTESLLLSLLGGGLGLVLALWSNRWLNGIELGLPVQLALGLSIDWRVLLFSAGVSMLTALGFGLVPALRATRRDLSSLLKEESRATGGPRKRLARGTLVVAQVSLSLLLLICAGLSLRSTYNAHRIDPGFDSAGVVVASFYPQLQGYTAAEAGDFFRRLLEQVEGLPGVESVGFASHLLLSFGIHTERMTSDDGEPLPPEEWPEIDTMGVGPGYFEMMRIPLLQGRGFNEQDGPEADRVAVVNESLARRFWPDRDPIGRLVLVDGEAEYRVVGVTRTGKYRTLGEQPRPFLYRPIWQSAASPQTVLARVNGNPRIALGAIRQAARQLDPKVPASGLGTLAEAMSTSLLLPRVSAALFGLFGLLGLLLAGLGVYGVISYAVSQRTHEIGIRVAMGARGRDILMLVVRQGLWLTFLGVTVGLAAAVGVTRALSAVLYGVSTTDVPTFVGVSLFIVLVALAASYFPARRAARLHPVVALRHQ